jgi:zinc D-Ala-D-Ala dipeptidase
MHVHLARAHELRDEPETARFVRNAFRKGGWRGLLKSALSSLEGSKMITYERATFAAELGERDRTFALLNEAYDKHDQFILFMKESTRLRTDCEVIRGLKNCSKSLDFRSEFKRMKKHFLTIRLLLVLIFFTATAVCAQTAPPKIQGATREADLVELVKLDKTIKLDIRYARTDNFVGKVVYPEARAFLQRDAAEALLHVHKKLKKQGLGLVIFDGYRPWRITKLFWEVTPEDKRKFVANPATGSRHNRGCAVDLSMYDLKTGKLIDMPSDFDEFTERASPDYQGGTEEQRKNRDLLRRLMEAEGFIVNSNEWWHFDYKDWKEYQIYDVAFSEIKTEKKKKTSQEKSQK